MTTQYFEDVAVGETRSFGERTITKAEMIEFAERYDPQPFHVDEAAAEESVMGGLVASGWHTAAVCMRLLVENVDDRAMAGARGIDDLRWIEPVRPGDTISVELEVVDKYPSDRKGVGHVDERLTGYADGEAVISWIALEMVRRRPDGDG